MYRCIEPIASVITQPSKYGVIVYFLLCHESLNYCQCNSFDYWLELYHGLVSCFADKTRNRLSACATTMQLQFAYVRRRFVAMAEMRHGLTALNPNNFVVYVWKQVYSRFLI